MKLVSLEIQNANGKTVRFKIPRAYISDVSDPRQTTQTFINIVVYLPDFLPRVLADQGGHQTRGEIVNGIQLRSQSEIIVRIRSGLGRVSNAWIQDQLVLGQSSDPRFNLYYRRRIEKNGEVSADRYAGYLIPIDDERVIIEFFANPKTSYIISYSAQFSFRDELTINTSFAAAHLNKYSDIVAAVEKILSGIVLQ